MAEKLGETCQKSGGPDFPPPLPALSRVKPPCFLMKNPCNALARSHEFWYHSTGCAKDGAIGNKCDDTRRRCICALRSLATATLQSYRMQYKVAPGDRINIEKLDAEVGAEVELPVICVVDGETVEADPAKAAATKVVATVIEQFKGEKVLVFKFKKRKNYKKLRGHRQQLTRVEIKSVGTAAAE